MRNHRIAFFLAFPLEGKVAAGVPRKPDDG